MKPTRYALVTGASRGIGMHFARALAERSWDLIAVARSPERLNDLANELRTEYRINVEAIALDLAESGAAAELVREMSDRGLNHPELLVNNAGHGDRGRFSKLPVQDQLDAIRLNVLVLVELTRLLLPPMIARGRGGIINVSSTAGFQPMPYAAVYAASKAFVTSFSMALAEEVRPQGVTVVTVCPGPTRTTPTHTADKQTGFPVGLQPAEDVVREALNQLERSGGLVVPRLINKIMAFSNRLMPMHLSAKVVARAMRPKDT